MLARLDQAAGHMNPFLALIAIGLLVLNVLGYTLIAPYLGRRGPRAAMPTPTDSALSEPTARLAGLQ